MKRIVSLLLALIMMMTAAAALAEGKTLTWARAYESTSWTPPNPPMTNPTTLCPT